MAKKKTVVIGLYGTQLDRGAGRNRWERWRPSVALCQQDDMFVKRFELLCPSHCSAAARVVAEDIAQVSPGTEVRLSEVAFEDPWDFEEVYEGLHAFARGYRFDAEREEY